jgi:3-hydroxybutyryl-CoA dehydrogenase
MAEIKEPIEGYGLSQKNKVKTLFSKIGVIGCGMDGRQIVRIASISGIEVVFIELDNERIQVALDAISKELDDMIDHWGMTSGEKRAIMARIKGTLDYKDLNGCDMVIESIRTEERLRPIEYRQEIFKKIEQNVDRDTIIATHSAAIIISELSAALDYKERTISLNFFMASNDAQIVEVTRGIYTSDEVYDRVCKFVKLIKRQAIEVEESAGLISIRLITALVNEACEVLLQGVSTKEDIDAAMCLGLGLRQGPFEIADKLGLDKIVRWMDILYDEFGLMKYKASPVIKKLVRANHVGRRTGQGFYKYDENGRKIGPSKEFFVEY